VSKRLSFHAIPLWVLLVGTLLITAIAISYGGGEYIRAQEMTRMLAQHQKKVESSLTLLASAMADAVVVQDTPVLKKTVDEMNEIVEGVHNVRIINDFNKQIFSWQSDKPVTGEVKQFTSEIRRGKDQYLGKLLLVWDTGETVKEIAGHIQQVRINIAIFMAITGLVILIWMHLLVIDPVMRINQRLKLGSGSEPLKQHWWTARELLRLKHTVARLEEVTISKEELEKEVERRKDAEVALIDLRDEALEASRAKSAFLANMSHELRTPLNAIIGYSEMLKDDANDQEMEDYVDDLGKIHSAGRHLLTLINEVLDLSKVEAGKMELHLETFDLTELIRAVVSTLEPMAKKNSNSIRSEGLGSPLLMRADFTKVRQILFNLLSNAIKFTDHGEVTILVKNESMEGAKGIEEGIEIDVIDSGIGITQKAMEGIFEPFQQADASTTRKYGGTGLGLALCRRFCEMMGGYIKVESEVGKGTVFSIWLPLTVDEESIENNVSKRKARVQAANPKDKRLPEGAANHLKKPERRKRIATVLTIDDDPNVLELMERIYNREGFRAVSARSGEDGIELARKLKPDLITLDIMMPGMDGWEVLRRMKEDEVLREIPVIMVSIVENKPMALDVGALASLTKPIAWDRLLDLTRMAVRGELTTIK
jgi:signal transduction histidine kinase/ActR/RegA family two-component response regulator